MKRNPNGKFAKALVRVGDLVVCDIKGFNPGFTKDKPYKVVMTARCKERTAYGRFSQYFGSGDAIEITKPNEFAVIDDNGLCRKLSLTVESDSSWRKEHSKVFGEWMILP